MARNYRLDSFIRNPPLIDGVFLDINTLPNIPPSPNDEQYVIDGAYDQRPDLLAYQVYDTSRLWWVFALRNPDVLVDPIRDFKTGVSIILPAADLVKSITGLS
jgi:hypothetical protein